MTFSSDNSLITNQLPISLDIDSKDENFDDIMLIYLRRIANAMNTKESGLFLLQENASFEQWYQLTPTTSVNSQQNRNGYRLTMDLVNLNFQINGINNIPVGSTSLTLSSSTQPKIINGYLYPVQGFGGAIESVTGISYFLNDPVIYVRYNSSTNTIIIQNNAVNALTWCVWVMEYLKN